MSKIFKVITTVGTSLISNYMDNKVNKILDNNDRGIICIDKLNEIDKIKMVSSLPQKPYYDQIIKSFSNS